MTAPRARAIPQEHGRAVAADGVSIAYTLWNAGRRELLVIAPGFWRVRRGHEIAYLATHFARSGYAVASRDFRGHGESGGVYSFGALEPLDLMAVLEELAGTERPFSRFSLLGFSLGGSIAIHALARSPGLSCRALALVSSPTAASAVRPKPWRAGAVRQVSLRQVFRTPRMNPSALLSPSKTASEAIASLTMPKLIVTIERDWLVDPAHGAELARAAAAPVEHVHLQVPGSLHADALVRDLPLKAVRLLDQWFRKNAPP